MVALADIPLVMPLAEWVWGADPSEDVGPELCLASLPFITMGCFSQLLTKALGLAIILGSCLNKTPIMLNIYNSKSATGLSRNSLYGEVIVYANAAFYGFLEGHPFTAYGENGALLLQNLVIIALAWKFSGNSTNDATKANSSPTKTPSPPPTTQEKALCVAGFLAYAWIVLFMIPSTLRYILMTSIWPILIYSRGIQIYITYQQKQIGNLSIITTTLNLVGTFIRIITTLKETGDTTVIMSFVLSFGLNLIMFIQYWLYLERDATTTTTTKEETEESKKTK